MYYESLTYLCGAIYMRKTVIQTRIEQQYKEQLEGIADTYGFSVSSLIRLIIIGIIKTNGLAIKDFITLAPNKPVYLQRRKLTNKKI